MTEFYSERKNGLQHRVFAGKASLPDGEYYISLTTIHGLGDLKLKAVGAFKKNEKAAGSVTARLPNDSSAHSSVKAPAASTANALKWILANQDKTTIGFRFVGVRFCKKKIPHEALTANGKNSRPSLIRGELGNTINIDGEKRKEIHEKLDKIFVKNFEGQGAFGKRNLGCLATRFT